MQNQQLITHISSYFSSADILSRPGSPSLLPASKPPCLSGQVRVLGCSPQKLKMIGLGKMTRVKNTNCRVGHKPKDRTTEGSSASKAMSLFRVCLQDDHSNYPLQPYMSVSQVQTLRRNIIIDLTLEKTLLERVRCLPPPPSEQSRIGIAIGLTWINCLPHRLTCKACYQCKTGTGTGTAPVNTVSTLCFLSISIV